MQPIRYEIAKTKSLITALAYGLLPVMVSLFYLRYLFTLFRIPDLNLDFRLALSLSAVLLIVFSLWWAYTRFRFWKSPIIVEFDDNGLNMQKPDGKMQNFSWSDVKDIRVEGGGEMDIAKKIVPYIYMDNFSWNGIVWSVSNGTLWLGSRYAFLHILLRDRSYFIVPVSKEELSNVNNFINEKTLAQISENASTYNVSKLRSPMVKLALIALVAVAFLLVLFSGLFEGGGVLIAAAVLIGLLVLFLLVVSINGIRRQEALIGSHMAMGKLAYFVAAIYFAIALSLINLIRLLISANFGQ